MILENKIIQALKFFGHLTASEINEKLKAIGVNVESRDLDAALRLLVLNGQVRKTDFDALRYVAR